MRVAIVDKGEYASKEKNRILKRLKHSSMKIVTKNPDVVISFGGDGTFFIAEAKFPYVPKLLLKDSNVCYFCDDHDIDVLLHALEKGSLKKEKCMKLKVGTLEAVNDIIIRSKKQQEALRFRVKVNNKVIGNEHIGDGLVIATSFGSTGYFKSITRKTFKKGSIGIAFNNTVKPQQSIIIKDNATITIHITRGTATLSADNNPKLITIKQDHKVTIKKSKKGVSLLRAQ